VVVKRFQANNSNFCRSRARASLRDQRAQCSARKLPEDGLETTFALNHMAYFVVTGGLRERLVASAPARVVSTASAAHQDARLDFDDLQLAKNFGPMKAYGRSKLCNILLTRELAHRLRGTGVTANCLHPGFVATRFADESESCEPDAGAGRG
jgi:NAD(P)-dependent dehydrogenase (short-subunit alcohol dehydrogenase family)